MNRHEIAAGIAEEDHGGEDPAFVHLARRGHKVDVGDRPGPGPGGDVLTTLVPGRDGDAEIWPMPPRAVIASPISSARHPLPFVSPGWGFQGVPPLGAPAAFLPRPPSGAAPSILDGAAMLEAGLGLEDLVAAYAMVFMAAFETTISMVGNATLALLTHPDQLDLLRRCPELAANAVEELLRFDGAVRGGVRCTLEEVEIGGQRIPPGEKVWLSFLAANRDPEMFAAPDRLQLQRANAKQHVAFAHGPHYCLGAYLARLELQCALRGLVRRRFALASEPTDLRWRRSSVFRTLERLPIVPEGDAQKTCE